MLAGGLKHPVEGSPELDLVVWGQKNGKNKVNLVFRPNLLIRTSAGHGYGYT